MSVRVLCLACSRRSRLREVDVCDEAEAPRLEHGVHEHIPERRGRPLDQHVFYRKPRDAEEDPVARMKPNIRSMTR